MSFLYCCLILIINIEICVGNDVSLPKAMKNFKFDQSILAVGVPYYKLLMVLGKCNKSLLFDEQKAWGKVKYNRVLDIYYKSDNSDITVSKVAIIVVLDDTDCSVYSKEGIGHSEFSAKMFIPTRVSMVFYHLQIWTCDEPTVEEGRQFEMAVDSREKLEDYNINKLPFYQRPLRPDIPPHHIYYDPSPVVYTHPNRFDKEVQAAEAAKNINSTTSLPLSFIDIDG